MYDWKQTTPTNRQLSVEISSDILASLTSSISLMFLNEARSASDGITMFLSLLTHLNLSPNKKLLLEISDFTRLEIILGKSSIDYISRVRGISQRMQGVTIDHIIPLSEIAIIDHVRYPGVKSRYLTVDTALVNCDLLQLSGLLSSNETRQHAIGIPNIPPSTTIANPLSNTPSNPPNNGYPAPQPPNPQRNHPA